MFIWCWPVSDLSGLVLKCEAAGFPERDFVNPAQPLVCDKTFCQTVIPQDDARKDLGASVKIRGSLFRRDHSASLMERR